MRKLILCLAGLGLGTAVAAAETVHQGPQTRSGCLSLGGARLKLVARPLGDLRGDDLHRLAREVSRKCDSTHEAGERWFYWTRPKGEARALWLLWKNVDSGEYGFALAKASGGVWEVTTNSGRVYAPRDDERQRLSWWTAGRRVDIDLFNPRNDKEWKAGDLWYRFGH